MLLILTTLFGSLAAHATTSPCGRFFDADRALIGGPLTPSTWLTRGDELARRVIAELPRHRDPVNSGVWLDFQKDPRWRKPSVGTAREALGAAMEFGRWYEEWMVLLRQTRRGTRAPPPRFFVTWEITGIRAINRLANRRIYVAGLTEDPVHVDAEVMDEIEYVNHDVGHAYAAETLRYPTEVRRDGEFVPPVGRRFYRTFDYERETRRMSPREHLLFDVGYFLYFHERIGENLWTGRYHPGTKGKPDTDVAKMYRSFDDVKVVVDGDDVRVTVPKFDVTVRRFLDRGDLYVNLPLEVKAALATHPKPHRLVREFMNEAHSVFFTAHYRHARWLLGAKRPAKQSSEYQRRAR